MSKFKKSKAFDPSPYARPRTYTLKNYIGTGVKDLDLLLESLKRQIKVSRGSKKDLLVRFKSVVKSDRDRLAAQQVAQKAGARQRAFELQQRRDKKRAKALEKEAARGESYDWALPEYMPLVSLAAMIPDTNPLMHVPDLPDPELSFEERAKLEADRELIAQLEELGLLDKWNRE